MEIIKLDSVRFRYGGQKSKYVLDDVSLTVNEGEFIAILGHNGSGKSTLAKLLNGLLLPSSGTVSVAGMNTKDENVKIIDVRRLVGVVFQNPDNQMVATIIEDDIAFGPENLGVERSEIGERIDWALESVGMQQYRKREPFKLSGGQKQRIAIAGVLAIKPRVLVLDEATAMLDPTGRAEIMRIVKKLREENNITVITITHFMDEAQDADRVIVLSDGKKYLEGTPAEVFSRREELEKTGLIPPMYVSLKGALEGDFPEVKEADSEQALAEVLCR